MPKHINSFPDKNEKGFTLVEILVSLVILLILVVAFVPMFTFVAQAVSNNQAKDTATALANKQIEYLRTLPFVVRTVGGEIETDPNVPQLGFIGGNPVGSIPASDAIVTEEINGKLYTKKTDISWDASGKFKKVTVSVEYPSAFGNNPKVINKFYTLAAEEGELDLPQNGNIRVQIFDKDGYPFVSKDILVKVVDNDGLEQQNYTESGVKLFGILEAGFYTVYAKISDDISYRPDQTIHNGWLALSDIKVDNNNTKNANFHIDLPGKINLKLKDDDVSIVGNGNLEFNWTNGSETEFYTMDFASNDFLNKELLNAAIKNKLGNLWPGGSYSIKLSNVMDSTTLKAYYEYDMYGTGASKPKLSNGSDWNGSFETAGSSLNLTVKLDSSLKTHLDAAKGVTTESYSFTDENTGEEITINQIISWKDQSGNDCDASPENDKPILVDNYLNGHPVIKFTRNQQQVLKINTPDIPDDSRPSDDFTVFVVTKPTENHPIDILGEQYGGVFSAADSNDPLDKSHLKDTAQRYLLYPDHGGVSNVGYGFSVGQNGFSGYEHGDNYMPPVAIYAGNLSEFNILGVRYQGKYPNLIINGSLINNTWAPNTTWHPREHVFAPKYIGGDDYGYFDGYIAEILIYDASLSDANIELVSNCLKGKYGL